MACSLGRQWLHGCCGVLKFTPALVMLFLAGGCNDDSSALQTQGQLIIPERGQETYITDQVHVAGKNLYLWNEAGGCQLQVTKAGGQAVGDKRWLKPQAPCYFIRSPGTQKVLIFKQDKTTRIVALLGTPMVKGQRSSSDKRCGREVQGLLVSHQGAVSIAERILTGSVYCVESGLDNYQYSLFYGS